MALPEDFYAADGWHSVTSLREAWADASQYEDAALEDLLATAKDMCQSWLGDRDVTVGEVPVVAPANYRVAQAMQVRDLAMGAVVGTDGGFGDPSAPAAVFPMTWQVKGILVPRGRMPYVG